MFGPDACLQGGTRAGLDHGLNKSAINRNETHIKKYAGLPEKRPA